jgi:uncharacterized membrane protein HdeD (DUF308 family)
MNMPRTTIIFSILLILLGLIGYFATARASVTALIPAFLGVILLILGILGQRESLRKHTMHVAAALGFLGLIGAARGLPAFFSLIEGHQVVRPAAAVSQAIMVVLLLLYVAIGVRSFIDARRSRKGNVVPDAR